MNTFGYHVSILSDRVSAHFSSEKHLHKDRFAYPRELVALSHAKPHQFVLLLGLDQFGRILQLTPTDKRKKLGNVLKVGPSQCGKSTDFKEQLKAWQGSVIVNDIKGELSRDTAAIRAEFSDVYCLNPAGGGNHFDPLLGKTTEHELHAMAKLLLHEPREDGNSIAVT